MNLSCLNPPYAKMCLQREKVPPDIIEADCWWLQCHIKASVQTCVFCFVFIPRQSQALSLELHDKVVPLTPLKARATLSNEDILRYSRQLLLPELGVQGTDGYSVTTIHSTAF